MNRHQSSQSGFTLIEVVVVIAVLAIVGFLGWRLLSSQASTTETRTDDTSETKEAPIVKNEEDLNSAEEFLNDKDIDNSLDTSEIDAALSE